MNRINLVVIGFALFLFSCKQNSTDNSHKTVFRYNDEVGVNNLDPAFSKDQSHVWVTNQIYNGLVQIDDSMRIKPCIAKRWTISPDGRTYTFYLRTDVTFQDDALFPNGKGRRVIAADFVYSFSRILDRKLASSGAWVFNSVDTLASGIPYFIALNDTVFEIKLKHSFIPFLGILTMPYSSVLPKEVVQHYGQDFRKHPVGTGPFQFKYWKEGNKLVLVKNPHYFEVVKGNRLPYLDAVSISFIPDKQTAFLKFIKGNLDFLSGLDPSYKDELLTRRGELKEKYKQQLDFIKHPYLSSYYLGFLVDTTLPNVKTSPWRLKKIRQAINCGFDRAKMLKYLRNNIGEPAIHGFVPPIMYTSATVDVKGYDYNPERAAQLLAEAGYPHGKGLPPLSISSSPKFLDICEFIQNQLAEIGIQVKLDVNPPATMLDLIAQSKVPFFRAGWLADYPDPENFLSLFYSKNFTPGGPNYTRFSNKTYDDLYQRSQNELIDSARYHYYQMMDQLLIDEAPIVPLYYDEALRFTHKNIHNLGSNPMDLLVLKYVKKTP